MTQTTEEFSASPIQVSIKHPKHKLLIRTLTILVLAFGVSELFCRYVVGLGDPPLYQTNATAEYILQPSHTYSRFHKRFSVNRYGMRADDFSPAKSSRDELRVLVIGDSVIYGGVRIDQSEIDTEILKRNLQKEYQRPVVVGNASAKSWGPVNELEYLKQYGTLNADVVILELSSHDYADSPSYVPVVGISANYPAKRPMFALADLFKTYILPRYFHIGETPAGIDKSQTNFVPTRRDIALCREAERELFSFVRAHGAKVALFQHLSLPEVTGAYLPGYYANQAVAKEAKVPFIDDAEPIRAQLDRGKNPFYEGDPLHLNRDGQQILAQELKAAVELALREQ